MNMHALARQGYVFGYVTAPWAGHDGLARSEANVAPGAILGIPGSQFFVMPCAKFFHHLRHFASGKQVDSVEVPTEFVGYAGPTDAPSGLVGGFRHSISPYWRPNRPDVLR